MNATPDYIVTFTTAQHVVITTPEGSLQQEFDVELPYNAPEFAYLNRSITWVLLTGNFANEVERDVVQYLCETRDRARLPAMYRLANTKIVYANPLVFSGALPA